MILKRKLLLHQVHPVKLATDIAAAGISLYFLWQHELVIGLLIHFIPPLVGSAVVIRFADLESYKSSLVGMYLSRYMTPTAQAARLGGDLLTVAGAWFHAPLAIAIGVATVLAAWTYGLIFRSR